MSEQTKLTDWRHELAMAEADYAYTFAALLVLEGVEYPDDDLYLSALREHQRAADRVAYARAMLNSNATTNEVKP